MWRQPSAMLYYTVSNKGLQFGHECTLGIFLYLILREDFLPVVPKFLRRTLIKFGCDWRKIGRKGKCRKDSESTYDNKRGQKA